MGPDRDVRPVSWRSWRPDLSPICDMTEDQLVSEALQLVAAEDYAHALPLWEKARNTASETTHKCIYLLHEARCLRELKEFGLAEQRLQMAEKIDREKKLQLDLEHARVRQLYDLERYKDANDRSKRLLNEHAQALAHPERAELRYEIKLGLGYGLVSGGEFEEGVKVLSEILRVAENEDKRRIHYFCGLALHHLKRDDNAVREFKKVLESGEQDQLSADAHYDLAMIYKSREEFTAAKQHLQKAEGLQDKLTVPLRYLYTALAQVCNARGEMEETKKYIRLAESLPKMKQ